MTAPVLSCPRCQRSPRRCECTPGLGPVGRPFGPLAVQSAVEVSGLRSTLRHVLMVVARRATGTWGVWWGATVTLGDLVGVADRTIRTALGELVELGVLWAEERSGDTTLYRIRPDWVAAVLAGDGLEVDEEPAPEPAPSVEVSGRSTRNVESPDPRSGRIYDPGGSTIRGGRIDDPPIRDRSMDNNPPPSPPPRAEGGDPRVAWVARRALGDLSTSSDPLSTLRRYDVGEHALVGVWVTWARDGTWPDAPAGLRAREVRAGLREAAREWRCGRRAPAPPPPAQLPLPEPSPDDAAPCPPRSPSDQARAQIRAELGDTLRLFSATEAERIVDDLAADRDARAGPI